MNPAASTDRPFDDRRQIGGRFDWSTLAPLDDRSSDCLCPRLFAKSAEDVGQLVDAKTRDQVAGGRRVGPRVEAHVERRFRTDRKSPLAHVKLERRQSQVEENAVGWREAFPTHDALELGKAFVDEDDPGTKPLQTAADSLDGIRIQV
jgi:hypothetical protein